MKQRENNEIDLLLRGLARREGPSSAESEDSLSMHLDADELNSYVERTLPAGARARYTSHLADCSACRKMVYELTSASGVRVAEPAVSEEVSTGLRQKLRALFSPGLLRFALPAVAVLAFVAVGLVALRQLREPDLVALNQPQDSRNSSIERGEVDSIARPGESPAPIDEKRSAETRTTPGKGRETQAKPEKNEPAGVVTSTDSVTVTANRDASSAKAARVVSSPAYAPEPPPPAPKSQTTTAEERSEVAARQKEEADKRDAPAREQEGTRAQTEDRQNQAVAKARSAAPAGQSEMRPQTGATYSTGAAAKTKDDDADTRTVSGRRFRRQGSVWIDTAYQPSDAITTVMRGSEQFRALIADEPGIRAIAAQLSGEVVIVWKGKAYRIR